MNDQNPNKDHPGYTGHIQDDASGLTYMQARYYDPVIGRFLSIDPMTFTSMGNDPTYFNRYAYTGNDPVNFIDPFGEARFGLSIGAGYFRGLGARGQITITFDTESMEFRSETRVGVGLGARFEASAGGVAGPSRTDGTSASVGLNAQGSVAAELRPTPLSGEAGLKVNAGEVSISSEDGLDAKGPSVEPILKGGVGPVSMDADLVEAGLGVDGGFSATIEVESSITYSIKPLVDFIKEKVD
jgi:RHS repeat-associated protein